MAEARAKDYALVPIDKLTKDPTNARKHPEKNLEAIKGSLLKFGQQKPIVVTRKHLVIAGNGTLEAAAALGWDKIQVKYTDLSGPEAMAFALADNRTSELAEWDKEILGTQLQALREDGFGISDIGFFDLDIELTPAENFEEMPLPDYSVLGDEKPDLDTMRDGVRKAIQVEFELEHYDEAFALVKFWREKGAYVGMLMMDKLRTEKEKHENQAG